MPKVVFYPDNQWVTVGEGSTILEAARQAGVIIESPCDGVGTCKKCKVRLGQHSLKNIVTGSTHQLSKQEAKEGYVLSCEAGIFGDIEVHIENRQQNNTLQILSRGESFKVSLDPVITKEYYQDENVTRIYASDEVLGVEAGNTKDANYGVVVDIGTTTLVASLMDLNTGNELRSSSSLNPQAIHAQDVLSRIKFASEDSGLQVMYTRLLEEINRLIAEVAEGEKISRSSIYEVIFSGNTCMLHLASNTNPSSLGKYPYTPQINGAQYLNAKDHGLDISGFGIIYLPPIISSYVGADITSGVLASRLYDKKGVTLFVDIGTNGEMVIGQEGSLSATSTAAGPAFEGMNITHGMRAAEGAIEFFQIEEDGKVTIKTIGQKEPTGICGSGLLDIIGELVSHGVINTSGKFVEPMSQDLLPGLRERLLKEDGKVVFKVTDKVVLSQKDVRQVQLAKGAVRAGIEFLLTSKGVDAERVEKILIAGSFGYHLRAESLINIGLLPKEFEGKIDFIGNTSKSGGQAFLLNKNHRKQMEDVVKDVEVVELANYKNFDKVFVKCLNF